MIKILLIVISMIFVVLTVPVSAGPATTVGIGSASNIRPHQTATVSIVIQTDQQLGAATIRLEYNPSVVKAVSVSAGDLEEVTANVDNIAGRVRMVAACAQGKTGNITFANVKFEAVGNPEDTSGLTIAVLEMYSSAVKPITPDSVTSGTFSLSGRLEGDVDNNDVVNSLDALLVAQHCVGIIGLTGDDLLAADVDDKGTVNSADLLLIKQYLVHIIDAFPGGRYIP